MDTNQEKFIKSEIWTLTQGAAFQRANVYKNKVSESDKKDFKFKLTSLIEETILPQYKDNANISDETHIDNINRISDFSSSFDPILNENGLNFGVCQKLLNLALKYHWCLFNYPEPPHFPLDRRIQEALQDLARKENKPVRSIVSWTQMTDPKDYMDIIVYIRKNFLKNKSLAQFELEHFERRREQ